MQMVLSLVPVFGKRCDFVQPITNTQTYSFSNHIPCGNSFALQVTSTLCTQILYERDFDIGEKGFWSPKVTRKMPLQRPKVPRAQSAPPKLGRIRSKALDSTENIPGFRDNSLSAHLHMDWEPLSSRKIHSYFAPLDEIGKIRKPKTKEKTAVSRDNYSQDSRQRVGTLLVCEDYSPIPQNPVKPFEHTAPDLVYRSPSTPDLAEVARLQLCSPQVDSEDTATPRSSLLRRMHQAARSFPGRAHPDSTLPSIFDVLTRTDGWTVGDRKIDQELQRGTTVEKLRIEPPSPGKRRHSSVRERISDVSKSDRVL